jgi:hypothetical protein
MRAMLVFLLILLLAASGYVWWKYYFVFGEGSKSGELNYMVRKGYVFKTYEGKLIQSGFRSRTPNTVQSFDFDFSVEDERVARELMANDGKLFNLHYREYNGALPWRGYSRYVVDSIISMKDIIIR